MVKKYLPKIISIFLTFVLIFPVLTIFSPIEPVYGLHISALAYATGETFETNTCSVTGNIDGPPDGTYNTCQKDDDVYTTGFNTSALIGFDIVQVYANITYYGSVSGNLNWYYNSTAAGLTFTVMDPDPMTEGGFSGGPLTETYNLTSIRASWTLNDLNNTEIQFQNNDAGGSENAYVDAIYLTVVYDAPPIPYLTVIFQTEIDVYVNGTLKANNSETAFNSSLTEIANITATGNFNAFLWEDTGDHNHTETILKLMDMNYTVAVLTMPSVSAVDDSAAIFIIVVLVVGFTFIYFLVFRRK